MTDEQYKKSITNSICNILKRIEEIELCEIKIIEKIYNYNEFNVMFKNEIDENEYNKIINNLKTNKKTLITKLHLIKIKINNYNDSIKIYWEEYNTNYKNHMSIKLNSILSQLKEATITLLEEDNPQELLNKYKNFCNKIFRINIEKDLLESFAFTNKNYIIFGKNGSGKTRLLNYVKTNYFSSNSFVIPSDREIRFGKLNSIRMDYPNTSTLEKIFLDKCIYPNDILTIFIKDKEFIDLQNNNLSLQNDEQCKNGKTYGKIKEIFNSLGLDRKIILDGTNNIFRLYNDELKIEPYDIKNGSDGEKSIILLISYILLCPLNSFVFIDEPENHFNTALLNELFNLLEKEREDIIFVYCTHNIDFIELRNNSKLIYLDKFDGLNWNIKEVDSFDSISIEELVNIVGTKKQIIFIESEKDKLDYKFYSNLFTEFKIIPVSSCEKVINNCKLLNNENYLNFNRKAFGIIDNDFRSQEEINKYQSNQIFTLTYSEIENLLLSTPILEYVCKSYSLEDKIMTFKESVIEKAIKDKNGIIQDYLNKTYYKYQKKEHLKYSGSINNVEKDISEINEKNKNNYISDFEKFISNLETSFNNKNYDEIIKKYPNKGFISCLNQLEIQEERYIYWVIELAKKDGNFRKVIKEKLFKNFFD